MAQVKIGEKVPFNISDFKDAAGNTAATPTLQPSTSDSAVAVVVDVAPDTLSGAVQAVGVGVCDLVDGPEGGVVALQGGGVEVVAGDATSGTVTFGTTVPV